MAAPTQAPEPAPAAPTLVGQQVGKYELVRVVGRGGMGTVYEAVNTTIQKRVAMKCIDASLAGNPDAIARFQREALAASAVDSPHIVQIFDAGSTPDGTPFIVMELLRGRDLGSWLAELGRMSPAQALSVASQLLRGLGHAHAAGIVHRDLKPDNVFLAERADEPPTVKILDFGVSKIAPGTTSSLKTLTREGTIVGTPYYMSPEQAQGYPDVDGRTDLYSVGAILFECFAGRPPHVGDVYEQVIVSICMKDADDVRVHNPAVTEPIAKVLARALCRERQERYGSAREMLDALLGAGPPELRALASATPSGVLRIDIGPSAGVPTTPFGTPPRALDARPSTSQSAVSDGETGGARRELGPGPSDAAVPGAPPAGSGEREAHSTLPSGAPIADVPGRRRVAFAATVRADSGVTSVGPATPTADERARSPARIVALALSGLILVGAVGVIGVAMLQSGDRAGAPPVAADPGSGPMGSSTASTTGVEGDGSAAPTTLGAASASEGETGEHGAPTARQVSTGRTTAPRPAPTGGPSAPKPATSSTGVPRASSPASTGQPAPKPTATGLHILTE